ncbi:hypothetical protein Tco_1505563 [Tanacetum coccineum]
MIIPWGKIVRNDKSDDLIEIKGVKFKVEPSEDHAFEVEPQGNVDHVAEIWVTKGLLVKANGNVLGLEIVSDQSGNTLRMKGRKEEVGGEEAWGGGMGCEVLGGWQEWGGKGEVMGAWWGSTGRKRRGEDKVGGREIRGWGKEDEGWSGGGGECSGGSVGGRSGGEVGGGVELMCEERGGEGVEVVVGRWVGGWGRRSKEGLGEMGVEGEVGLRGVGEVASEGGEGTKVRGWLGGGGGWGGCWGGLRSAEKAGFRGSGGLRRCNVLGRVVDELEWEKFGVEGGGGRGRGGGLGAEGFGMFGSGGEREEGIIEREEWDRGEGGKASGEVGRCIEFSGERWLKLVGGGGGGGGGVGAWGLHRGSGECRVKGWSESGGGGREVRGPEVREGVRGGEGVSWRGDDVRDVWHVGSDRWGGREVGGAGQQGPGNGGGTGGVGWSCGGGSVGCNESEGGNGVVFFIPIRSVGSSTKRKVLSILISSTGRKAHLLENKKIPNVGVFDEVSFYTLFRALGWLLKEIHVTWAHLEKKRTRLRLYTKSLKKLCIQSVETASRVLSDDVKTFEVTASERGQPKETLEDFVSRD